MMHARPMLLALLALVLLAVPGLAADAGPTAPAPTAAGMPPPRLGRWSPIDLKLDACMQAGQTLAYTVTLSERDTGKKLSEQEIRRERVQVDFLVNGKTVPARHEGDHFVFETAIGKDAGKLTLQNRIVTTDGPIDGKPGESFITPDARVVLPPVTMAGVVEGGCAKDAHCVSLDLSKSQNLWPGLDVSITRKAPQGGGGWPDALVHLKKGSELVRLARDQPLKLAWDPKTALALCYAAPRCVPPPQQVGEAIEVQIHHPCLDDLSQRCKDGRLPGCKPPPGTDKLGRGAVTTLQAEVRPNSWLDCNLWWILIVAGVVSLAVVLYGILSPASFPSAAMLRVANSQRALAREQGRPLRREPHGSRGFYRTATVCFTDIGTTVLKNKAHVLQLKAAPGKQILVLPKGGQLERWERNAWKPVDPAGNAPGALHEKGLVSGATYRVGGAFFFTVDF